MYKYRLIYADSDVYLYLDSYLDGKIISVYRIYISLYARKETIFKFYLCQKIFVPAI